MGINPGVPEAPKARGFCKPCAARAEWARGLLRSPGQRPGAFRGSASLAISSPRAKSVASSRRA
jgi:hypothetical protein